MMYQTILSRSFFMLAKKVIIFTNALFIFLFISKSDCFSQELGGHWKSPERLTTNKSLPVYLNLDVCGNGYFSGVFGPYACVIVGPIVPFQRCSRTKSMGTEPVSGYINFNQHNGTITFEDCVDVPFTIQARSSGKVIFNIYTSDRCPKSVNFI